MKTKCLTVILAMAFAVALNAAPSEKVATAQLAQISGNPTPAMVDLHRKYSTQFASATTVSAPMVARWIRADIARDIPIYVSISQTKMPDQIRKPKDYARVFKLVAEANEVIKWLNGPVTNAVVKLEAVTPVKP
jgi:hypothetical protein